MALAALLAGGITIELARQDPAVDALPFLCGLLGTAPLVARRYAPLTVFVVVATSLHALAYLQPEFED